MSKSRVGILLALALACVVSSERQAKAWANWDYMIVAANETPFLGQGWWTVRHTWSDAWSGGDNQDATQSWHSGTDRCWAWGISGCSWAYRSWAFSHDRWYWTDGGTHQYYHSVNYYMDHQHNGFVYLVNGVCHQATNRSSRQSGLARVVDYGILGTGPSQSAFGTCGKWWPWGFGISCPT